MTILRFLLRGALHAVVAAAVSTPSHAQRGSFVITKGKDTVAVESYTRDATTLTTEIAHMSGMKWQLTATLRPDSAVRTIEAIRQTRAASLNMMVHFGDTLVNAQISAAAGSEKFSFAVKEKTTPFLALSFALAEQIVRASRLTPGKSTKWLAVRLGAADTATLVVTRFHPDSVSIKATDVELKVALSPKGEVIGGRHVAQEWLVQKRIGK
jgi:hypothetical protein